jgi:hypothetical protein
MTTSYRRLLRFSYLAPATPDEAFFLPSEYKGAKGEK